jgi:protease I
MPESDRRSRTGPFPVSRSDPMAPFRLGWGRDASAEPHFSVGVVGSGLTTVRLSGGPAVTLYFLRTSRQGIMSLNGKTILFFAGPLYEDLELWYPKIRLEEEGARTVVAGTGEKTYQGKRGYPLTVDTSVDEITADRFDGLVIPGGYAPDIMRRSQKLLQLTREIYQAGKPVAFICHAGWVPISAGIVRGKRGTSVGAIKDDLVNAGLLWEDSPVVVDGNLISSRTPADLPVFCKALIAALEKQPGDASQELGGSQEGTSSRAPKSTSSRAKRGTYSAASRRP